MKVRTAIVTGASKGIGRLVAEKLVKGGISVVGVARSESILRELENKLDGFRGVACDLYREKCCHEVFRKALEHLGRIDVLVNNVGTAVYGDFATQSWEEIRRQLMVNFVSVACLSKLAVDHMTAKGGGVLVYVLTGAVFAFTLGMAPYGGSKAGLHYLSETIRRELKDKGIKVINVYPGEVKGTEFFNHPSFRVRGLGKCKHMCVSAEDVADAIVKAIYKGKSRNVYVPGMLRFASKLAMLFNFSVKF